MPRRKQRGYEHQDLLQTPGSNNWTRAVCAANAPRNCRLTGSGMHARRHVPATNLQDEIQQLLRGVGNVLDQTAVEAAF